ncbi:MAG: aminotransferase class V-fold PLP-dependent enzyme [Sphaerochaeta sp.]|nr:aminotransferase class V-fold PLP-dependent enzyme [Sphaerochaeta sp.]
MIYLDNAATSWPKAPPVAEGIRRSIEQPVGNAGRSAHGPAMAAARILYDCRQALQLIMPPTDLERTIFTHNATEALNIALFGSLDPGDTVLTTPVEHNAVARVLHQLAQRGVHVEYCACDTFGRVDVDDFSQKLATLPIRLAVFTAAGNVTGAINDVSNLVAACTRRNIPFVIDGAQAIGECRLPPLPDDAQGALCFSIHKGLLGPTGVGVMALYGSFAPRPLTFGGTGSRSDSELQPEMLPDRYESGTPAIHAIAGSVAAIGHVVAHLEEMQAHRKLLGDMLYRGLQTMEHLRLLSPREGRVGLVSVTVREGTISSLAQHLYAKDIAVRGGYHCAPWAHRFLETEAHGGAVRFSVGPSTTEEEIEITLGAVKETFDG